MNNVLNHGRFKWRYAALNPAEENNSVNPSYITFIGDFNPENNRYILNEMGIKFDGNYRENKMDEKYLSTLSHIIIQWEKSEFGIYYYNFCVNSNTQRLSTIWCY